MIRDEIPQRIEDFKEDLRQEVLTVDWIIRKHITTGDPIAVSHDSYFRLRHRVAEQTKIHPSSVVLVGSCRTGFSLKKKPNPKGRYCPISDDSDVDVAIVSDRLFDGIWDSMYRLVYLDRSWAHDKRHQTITKDLWQGWINPTKLPLNFPRFNEAKELVKLFNQMTAERLCGYRKISSRIYRTWERLEMYQEHLVRECRDELKGELR